VIQGVVLVAACAFVLTNLVVDLIYSLVDPRIRHG
jgi:peptide/nickel transport system permease protein